MGKCWSTYVKKAEPYTVNVSGVGLITHVSDSFLECSGYEYRDLHHKHIADMLLTGVLANLHKNVFIPKFGKATGKEKARLRNFIKHHISKIMCTISTPNGLHKVFVSTEEIANEELRVTLICCENTELTLGTTINSIIPPLLHDCPIKTSPTLAAAEVGIIAMDLHGSTTYIDEIGIHPYVSSQKALFNELQRHLEVELFPLVQLHEVLGDSFLMTVNAPWWSQTRVKNLKPFLSIVACYLTWHLNDICEKYYKGKIYIRCGVAQGAIVANITGCHFRIYGQCLNVACRLESLCERNCVHIIDESSLNKCRLRGFRELVCSTQVCAKICPTIEEICTMVIAPGFVQETSEQSKERSLFARSKNVYVVKEPSLLHHSSETSIRSSSSSLRRSIPFRTL